MSLIDIEMKRLRGVLLELLRDGTKVSDDTLTAVAQEQEARQATRDQVRGALRWLEAQGYVSIDAVGKYLVARIRDAGVNYLEGRSVDDGIRRPMD